MAKSAQRENYVVKTLNGMAYGFFSSLIIGTILKQIGLAIHVNELVVWGQIASYLMGPAIGVGIAYVLEAKGLNLMSAVIAGTIGAGTFSLSQGDVSVTVGNPISAYLAVLLAVEATRSRSKYATYFYGCCCGSINGHGINCTYFISCNWNYVGIRWVSCWSCTSRLLCTNGRISYYVYG